MTLKLETPAILLLIAAIIAFTVRDKKYQAKQQPQPQASRKPTAQTTQPRPPFRAPPSRAEKIIDYDPAERRADETIRRMNQSNKDTFIRGATAHAAQYTKQQ